MDDDLERQMYHEGIKFLESRGFSSMRYQISLSPGMKADIISTIG